MSPDAIKKKIQAILGDGLVVIVGCGLSSAEGIPGMHALAQHILKAEPPRFSPKFAASWDTIICSLASGIGLEQALAGHDLPKEVDEFLVFNTARFIKQSEEAVFNEVLSGQRNLRFSSLVHALPPSSSGIVIITTNYDRLIELSCEAVGHHVDSMFVGNSLGRFHPKESAYSFCRGIRRRQGKINLEYAPRMKVLKPHGSLDWYVVDGKPLRCPYNIDLPPLIIPPGETKYRAGYEEPFDAHREHANREIDRAKRYLIIGYGFNDDHLQTHLARNLRNGKPCLVVSMELSEAGNTLINECPNIMALTANDRAKGSTKFRDTDGASYELSCNIWDLGKLVEEVFM